MCAELSDLLPFIFCSLSVLPNQPTMPATVAVEPLDLSLQIPYHFRCPISLELMHDPVTVPTGQTYDRSSIEAWVATGNTTCPVTRAFISDFTLIPNHTLRRLIQDWCVANRRFGVERIPTPKQPADPSLLRSILAQVSSRSNGFGSRISALRRLKGLARDSDLNRSVISSLNASEILIDILFLDLDLESVSISVTDSDHLRRESLAMIVMLPLTESECVLVASDPQRIRYVSNLLFDSSVEVRINAAALIEVVIAGTRDSELRGRICGTDEIFEGVVEILRRSPAYPRALKVGIKALFALCLVKSTRLKAVSAGAVEILVDRFHDLEKYDAERALATMELICRIPGGCAAFGAHAVTIPLLVKVILKISDRATESAVGALVSLCSGAEERRREAVAAGIFTQLLLLVQSDCTERVKRKSQVLLKLLRDSWPQDSVGNSDDYNCSEIVVQFC